MPLRNENRLLDWIRWRRFEWWLRAPRWLGGASEADREAAIHKLRYMLKEHGDE